MATIAARAITPGVTMYDVQHGHGDEGRLWTVISCTRHEKYSIVSLRIVSFNAEGRMKDGMLNLPYNYMVSVLDQNIQE